VRPERRRARDYDRARDRARRHAHTVLASTPERIIIDSDGVQPIDTGRRPVRHRSALATPLALVKKRAVERVREGWGRVTTTTTTTTARFARMRFLRRNAEIAEP